jgi:DNA repair protein RecO (recombination protein O)
MKQRSYKAMGINLKAMPMGEFDRLVTVLTKEHGLIRALAPGARKHKSRLGGRSGLFVVNELLFSKGKSIDKMIQAETLRSFPGLSQDLAKLTASQYLAEIALAQALSEQPQEELYYLLIEHLSRIELASKSNILPCLAQATFHMLALAGVAPDVFRCGLSRSRLTPQLGDPNWKVAFSVSSGGAILLEEIERLERDRLSEIEHIEREWHEQKAASLTSYPLASRTDNQPAQQSERRVRGTNDGCYGSTHNSAQPWQTKLQSKVAEEVTRNLGIVGYLSAAELALMQQLNKPTLIMSTPSAIAGSVSSSVSSQISSQESQITSKSGTIGVAEIAVHSAIEESGPHVMWQHIEKFLRQYAQYQFDRPIKSAALIDTCFTSPNYAARV